MLATKSWSTQSSSLVAVACLPRPPRFCARYSDKRLALDVAAVAHGHHHVGGGDQVFGAQVKRAVLHQAAAHAQLGLAKFKFDGGQFFADDGGDAALAWPECAASRQSRP